MGQVLLITGTSAKTLDIRCGTCTFFIDHRHEDDEEGEVNGYCCNPDHPSYGREYGGHWAYSESVCPLWKQAQETERGR